MSRHGQPGARSRVLFALLLLAAFVAFMALGWWQLERRTWKQALIHTVSQRLQAPPRPLPPPASWPQDVSGWAYLKVSLSGRFIPGRNLLVAATTTLGSGYWVLSPLALDERQTVLINRGFVPQGQRQSLLAGVDPSLPQGPVSLTGLLRLSEPGGAFLRSNQPGQQRWYSRDLAQMAAALQLTDNAPFFIDAAAGAPGSPGAPGPTGGLTVVSFRDPHLSYALTWFTLALMSLAGLFMLFREKTARGPLPKETTGQ